jgi:peptide deformylase
MNEQEHIHELVNPQIIETSGEQTGWEGCLSLPGQYGMVTRPMKVKVRAQDRNGEWFEVEDEGLTARCFCHEIDHLEGHMFDELCDATYSTEELEAMEAEQKAEGQEEQE